MDLFVLILGSFTASMLFCFHSHLMCINATTWEVVSRERITYLKHLDIDLNPFHEGYCKNMWLFLCSHTPRNWDRVYFRRRDSDSHPV